MMRLFIDTDTLLDVLQAREGFAEDAIGVWELCESGEAEGCTSSLSILDCVYMMGRSLTPDSIQDVLSRLSAIFKIVDLRASDIRKAGELRWRDFEDAVQWRIASREKAEYIVTRNVAGLEGVLDGGPVAISPADLLSLRR